VRPGLGLALYTAGERDATDLNILLPYVRAQAACASTVAVMAPLRLTMRPAASPSSRPMITMPRVRLIAVVEHKIIAGCVVPDISDVGVGTVRLAVK
jgi:hypothetical protein